MTATEKMSELLAEVLEEEGAEAIRFSLIHTEALESPELDRLVAHPEAYGRLDFTSSFLKNSYTPLLLVKTIQP